MKTNELYTNIYICKKEKKIPRNKLKIKQLKLYYQKKPTYVVEFGVKEKDEFFLWGGGGNRNKNLNWD